MRRIRKQGADYVLRVRDNHKGLHACLEDTFTLEPAGHFADCAHDYADTVGHGPGTVVTGIRPHVRARGPRLRPARAAVEGLPADRPLPGAQRARLLRGAGYNLLYRWFLDMDLMEHSFDATVFTKNRQRLMAHDVGRALFNEVVWTADGEGLLSDEHSAWTGP